jgi:hypothetical protein
MMQREINPPKTNQPSAAAMGTPAELKKWGNE